MFFRAQPDYNAADDLEDAPSKIETEDETEIVDSESLEYDEEYSTLSSPLKYFAFLTFFLVIPVGAYVYYYKGGKERVRTWSNNSRYSKLGGTV